jgi:hypothetical protein
MAGTHAARDHTHALFRTGSHSFLGNGATLFSRFRQCSHTAVEDLAVIVPDLYRRATVGAQPFKTGFGPKLPNVTD